MPAAPSSPSFFIGSASSGPRNLASPLNSNVTRYVTTVPAPSATSSSESCATTVPFEPRSAIRWNGASSSTTYVRSFSRPMNLERLAYTVPTPPSPETSVVRTVPGSHCVVVVKSAR